MRTLRLAQAAAQAEGLVLRRILRRAVRRGLYLAVAAIFALFAASMAHWAAFLELEHATAWQPVFCVATLFGADAVIALIFLLIANGTLRDPVEEEARLIRDTTLAELRQAVTLAALLGPLGRGVMTGGIRLLRRWLGGRARP